MERRQRTLLASLKTCLWLFGVCLSLSIAGLKSKFQPFVAYNFNPLNNLIIKKLTMKQKTKTWMAAVILSFISFSSFAQEEIVTTTTPTPRWVSDKGYWVVEGNIHSPLNHIVWFYNNDNTLIYKEVVTGIKLNVGKRKVKMKLKKALETSVMAWEQKRVMEENKDYLAAILK
jgi:hypothetical protein